MPRLLMFQLQMMPGNPEAVQGIQRLIPLRHDVAVARSLMASGDHEHAMHVLSACIEVRVGYVLGERKTCGKKRIFFVYNHSILLVK